MSARTTSGGAGHEATAATTARSWWGWGEERAALSDDVVRGLGAMLTERFGRPPQGIAAPVDPTSVPVTTPRVAWPESLAGMASADPLDRLRHGHGNAFRDVARALHGDVPRVPDLVVRPRSPEQVEAVLDHCTDRGIAVVPWGGGTSVVGGVTPPAEPAISLDLEQLDGVHEVDRVSLAARIGAGALGPTIEAQLRPLGLTFRHFPQSWEFSTLGGWLATRAGGHYATGPTHIDDLVEAVTACTPTGWWASRRLPASGAGPSPDRLLLGSEGTLGVITEAWVRVQRRPRARGQATLAFAGGGGASGGHGGGGGAGGDAGFEAGFDAALHALRALVQDGLAPANCRLLDPVEAALAGAAPPDGTETLLVLGFEAPEQPVTAVLDRALQLLRDHGARLVDGPTLQHGDASGGSQGGAGAWRRAFLQAPYLRDGLIRLGAVVETFETATTWERAGELVATLRRTAADAAREVCGGALVAVRTTHAYPDGVAPYLTVVTPGPVTATVPDADRAGRIAAGRAQASAWDEIKQAVSEAIVAAGATITHHHGVGRDHRAAYDRQRPEPFARALAAARAAVDPAGILNPGLLV